MYRQEREISLEASSRFDGRKSKYFLLMDHGEPRFKVGVDRDPTLFSVAWPANISIGEFLLRSSNLIDRVSQNPLIPRPLEDRDVKVIEAPAATIIQEYSSYSRFGDSTVWIMPSHGDADVSLEEIEWPLNLENIVDVARRKGGQIDVDDPDEICARLNFPACSIFFNGDIWGKDLVIWSHLPLIDEWIQMYKETSRDPISALAIRHAFEFVTGPSSTRIN